MGRKEMTGTEIIRDVMKQEGITQMALAERMGYANNSAVAGRLNSPRISAEKLVEMLGAMGYEVIVRKADANRPDAASQEWLITG